MNLHTLARKTKNKKKRVVGRGGKHAKTSGRGTKGQNARAGRKKRPQFRDTIKKIPKLRGYRFSSTVSKSVVVDLAQLEKAFAQGGEVTPTTLFEKGLVRKESGKLPSVKILSRGEISRKLDVSRCAVSIPAKAAIEKAGGSVKA